MVFWQVLGALVAFFVFLLMAYTFPAAMGTLLAYAVAALIALVPAVIVWKGIGRILGRIRGTYPPRPDAA